MHIWDSAYIAYVLLYDAHTEVKNTPILIHRQRPRRSRVIEYIFSSTLLCYLKTKVGVHVAVAAMFKAAD